MSHEITELDRVGLHSKQAWHGLGQVVDDDLTASQAADRFGLTWGVDQRPLVAQSQETAAAWQAVRDLADAPFPTNPQAMRAALDRYAATQLPVDSHVANVRTADCDGQPITHLLGVVGADYQVCQNRELAEFTDALAQTGQVVIESCGSIRGGKRVWFLARGAAFTIGDRDQVWPYVLVSNGHDGSQAIRVTPTTVRVVCSNTLHMVIPQAEGARPESAAITIRHSGKIADKLAQAKNALAYYGDTLRRNRELFEAMNAQRIDRGQAVKLFADTYSAFWEVATPEELGSSDDKTRRIARNRAERMRKASQAFLLRYEHEQKSLGLDDSAWLAFNAMTGFLQHDKSPRGKDDAERVDRRRESNLFGVNATRTHEVLAASLAIAG